MDLYELTTNSEPYALWAEKMLEAGELFATYMEGGNIPPNIWIPNC